MQLLLLSNSTNAGEEYLGWPRKIIGDFLSKNHITSCLFVPYAGVTTPWDEYTSRVQEVFSTWACSVEGIHRVPDVLAAVEAAACIVVGGGNTFRLVQMMHDTGIMQAIRQKVLAGTPFIGWSAGSNVACPTLRTTNDMPVIQPPSFDTLSLIPFQINPHYLDANPEGHGGETREQRITEFLAINRGITVAGLREATALLLDGTELQLLGNRNMRLFRHGETPEEYEPGSNLSFLLGPVV